MRRQLLGALLALAFALVLAVLVLALAGPSSAAPTYIDGDWDIDNGDTITRTNEEIVLTGNLTVKTGGELTLRSVTLKLNSTSTQRYHITVEDGGVLYIYDGDGSPSTTADASLITANDASYNYAWYVLDGGELYINDSRVEECGDSSPGEDLGLNIESSSVVVDSVAFKNCYYGLWANYASPTVRDSSFTDMESVGVHLLSSSTNVLRCTFSDCLYGVLAYYAYPRVTDSTFSSITWYGIYLYDAAAEIDGCTMSSMGYTGIITQYNSVTITDTVIDGAVSYGVLSYYSTLIMARDTANDSGTGLYSYRNADGSSISDCKATNCSSNGVYVYLAPTALSNVRVYDSTTNGIYLNRASGSMTGLRVEDAAVGLYLRDSTSTVTGLVVKDCTSSGLQSSGGSPTVYAFAISGSSTGITGSSTTTLRAYNGSVSTSTTRDVDVSGTSTVELTNVTYATGLARVQDAGSLLHRYWWADLRGVWQDGSPVATGGYTVANSGGSTVLSGTLGSDGYVRALRVQQTETSDIGTTTYTPHTFTVTMGGLSGNRVSTIDANRLVTVTVTDSIPPSGYIMLTEPLYTKGTWNQVSWTAGSDVGVGGIEYWCEMSDVSDFSYYIGSSGWTTSTSQTFSGLSDGVLYYHRVRARDSVGNVGSWSNVVSSTQDSAPPSVPVVVEEPDHTLGTSNTVTWGASTDAGIGSVSYQAQYTDDPTFATVLGTSAWQAGTTITYTGLTDGTRYYYRVRSRDGFLQESLWSQPVRTTQDASAPPTPDMDAEDGYTKGLSNTVSWTTVVDTGIGGVAYYAEWDDEWWFPSPGGNSGWLTATSHTFTGLPENTWVYYRVRARDALLQESAPSWVVWSWQDSTPPSVPVITAEPQWTAGHSNTVYWASSSDGSGAWGIEYNVEADVDQAFGSPDFRSDWTVSTGHDFSSLIDGVTYYYRVKSRDALGWESSWSSTTSSTQDASAPPAPSMDAEPAYTPGASNAVSWSQVTDAGIGGVEYQAQCSDRSDFSTVVGDSGWLGTTGCTFSGLGDGTKYYFHVRSRDSFDTRSAWSGAVYSTQDGSGPPAPTIHSEPTYTGGSTNTVSWDPVTDAGSGDVEYQALYDDDWWFGSPNGNSGWVTATEFTFTGVGESTWWYYIVHARDAAGNEGGYSGRTWSLQDATAPTAPAITAQPAYTAGTTNTVYWSGASDGSGSWDLTYYAEAGATPSFAPPLADSGWITDWGFTFSGLTDGTTYYFHVKARDQVGNEGPWSTNTASTQDASPPPAPTIAAEPAYTQGTSNPVAWTVVTDPGAGGVQYEAIASTSSVFATLDATSGWVGATSYTFTGLTDGATYYYRAHARDALGQVGTWSNIVSSTQDGTAPGAPVITTEPTYTQGTTNTLYWSVVTDAISDGVTYWAEYDDDWQFRSPNEQSGWTSQTQYTFTGIAENTWDYYRVKARDGAGNEGPWSAGFTWSRQDATAPTVPTVTAEPAYTAGTTNAVSWSASTDGAGSWGIMYYAEAGIDPSITPPVHSSDWIASTSWTFTGLSDAVTYYYHVRARDAVGNECPWSTTVSSTQDASAPPAPTMAPEPAYTQGATNDLYWSAVADVGVGAVEYEVEASTSSVFAVVEDSSGWTASTGHTFSGLSETTHYYRVHARDSLRQVGQWSNVVLSTQDATGPSAPAIVAEPAFTAGTSNTVYWGASTDAGAGGISYYVWYDDDWQFGSPNDASGLITATQYTFNNIPEDVVCYYEAIAMDAVGNWGAWSGVTWSAQDDSAPTVPAMTAEPAYTAGTTNAVAWSASADGQGVGGITYQSEVSNSNTFAVVLDQSAWTAARGWTFSGLVDGTTYYYRVRARDALDHVSSYSNVVSSTQDASAPPAPFLAAEPAYTVGTSNALTWSAVVDGGASGVQYNAQRSTSPAFTAVVSSGWISATTYTFSGLTDATLYYYRVAARDSLGLQSAWSNVERSTQDNSAPTAPGSIAPPLYTKGTSLTFSWTASTDAGVGGIQYWAEYDNDVQFRSVNGNSGWVAGTSATFSNLAEGTLWFYRVRARDAFATTSGWSTIRFSIQDNSPPTQPTMSAEPTYTDGTSNAVSWTASTDAGVGGVEYQVLCDNDANMATPVHSSGWIASRSHTFFGLSDGVRYYYAAQSRDAFDQRSALSATVSSTQDASAPTTPALEVEPEYTQGLSNTLAWSDAVDAGIGGVQYRLEWATAPSFAALSGSLDWFTGTSATVSSLSDATKYYWRVRARDSLLHLTPWSNVVWSIQDASSPPSPAMTAEPTYTAGTSNTLYWSAVADAGVGGVQYLCELSTDATFTSPLASGWTTRTEWTWSNLGDGSRYYYRVRSRDGFDQRSAWSNSVSSTQDDRAPTVPTLTAEPAYTAGTTNQLAWSAATDAGVGGVEYEVQCGMDSTFATVGLTSGWTASTGHTFSGLSDGVTYYYRVRSRDAFDHRSAWSSAVYSTQDASPPTSPSLAAEPPYTQGTSNTVAWSASTDAGVGGVQYLVQCAQDGAFTSIVGQAGWSDATSATFSNLRDGTTYYYRARSRDAFGYTSPWSVVERSTQDASPPTTPELVAEPAFTEGTSNTLAWTLSIDAGAGGVLYWCEWDFSASFQSPRGNSGWVPALEWTFAGLPERAIYYRVRATDALGQQTPWSRTVVSTQDASPPTTPALNDLPVFTKGRAVGVSWSPAVDLGIAQVQYWAEWDDDPAFGSPGGSSGWVPAATHTFDGLPEHVALSLRVRARDAFDHRTPWSPPKVTTCDASAPSVPYLASEPLYTEGTTNRLEWSTSIDLGIGGVEYDVQATTDPTWDRVDLDSGWIKATAHTFTGLLDAKVYYYRARARDTFQWTSAWSPVVSSVQDAAPPPVPALRPEPAFTEGRENTLEWTEVVDAGVGGVEYELQWSAVGSFATVGGDSGWLRELRHTFTGLPEGASVHYRLRARDAFGQESSWSAGVVSAQDDSPPQVPIVRPESAYTGGSSNTVEWLAALDAGVGGVQYLAQASTGATFTDVVAESGWASQTSYTFRNLGDGVAYSFRVRARDAFGHESAWSTPVTSTQDASAPTIVLDPLPGVIATRTLRLTGAITDPGSGAVSVEFSDDGGATWQNVSLGPSGWTFTWTRYSSGRHTLLLRATDALGNRLAPPAAVEVDVDLDAPEAAMTSPATNATLTGLVPVRGTATDAHMARFGLYWTRNGVNLTAIVEDQPFTVTGSTLAIWDTHALDDGEYVLMLQVNDTTGRTTWANVTVRLLNSDMEMGPGDLALSDPFPHEGDNLTITATLRNTGTSRARDVRITVTDNGAPLYEGTHMVGPGDVVTIQVPYVVPDHKLLHTIRVQATYRDNPGDKGAGAVVSLTGKEVVEEPFFSTSELATLALAIVVAVLGSLLGAWLLDRRRGYAVVSAPVPAASAGMSFSGMQKLGMETIKWDDDRF